MSPETVGSTTRLQQVRETFIALLDAYRYMEIPFRRYILFYLLPSILIAVSGVSYALIANPPQMIRMPLIVFGAFAPLVALVYPRMLRARQSNALDEQFHLFVTHLTMLSLTNTNRVNLFRTIANEDEYGEIAKEMGRLIALIETWNMSLDDACRQRAKSVPSDLMSDFYERLAYTVGAGQQISDFLTNEQDAIIQDFATQYEANLDRMDVFAELYLSIVLSAVFAVMFAVIVPFLTGIAPEMIIGGTLVSFLVMEILFIFLIDLLSPEDPLWFQPDSMEIRRNRMVTVVLAWAIGLTLLIAIGLVLIYLGIVPLFDPDLIPTSLYPAIPTVPLLVPGVYIYVIESRLMAADAQFPSFIRGLGAVESVKQSSTANVLETLRQKDFGTLDPYINALYRRLKIRIDTQDAWRFFSAEIGSYLIQNFSDMYVQGREMGGDPATLGRIISQNMTEVLKLREYRQQVVSTMIGQLYGISVAASFSFFVSVEVVKILVDITSDVNVSEMPIQGLLNAGVYDVGIIYLLVMAAVVGNALISAFIIQRANRRYVGGVVLHFTIILWLSLLTGVAVEYMAAEYLRI